MKRPYCSPKLTKYNSLSDVPPNVRQELAALVSGGDRKIFIPPNGNVQGQHGLSCARCGQTFYASTPKLVSERFDAHLCEEKKKESAAEAV